MLGLVLFPLVDDGSGLIRSPANALHHITFAVCAQFALASKPLLHSLLQHVPSASFTFFSGSWSRGISYDTYAALRAEFPKEKCFFDVKIADMQRPVDNILKMLAEEEHQKHSQSQTMAQKKQDQKEQSARPLPRTVSAIPT
ncbi:unnamed protein product [Amoebophrya sp. A25]|nr:unnamed protein product [Amoebophrya sp. A25]|eukprot:GSA25T00013913001.1